MKFALVLRQCKQLESLLVNIGLIPKSNRASTSPTGLPTSCQSVEPKSRSAITPAANITGLFFALLLNFNTFGGICAPCVRRPPWIVSPAAGPTR